MKQFIVLLAGIPLLFSFVIEYTTQRIIFTKVNLINDVVYAAKEEAKQNGCFTEEAAAALKDSIDSITGTSCTFAADNVPKERITEVPESHDAWENGLIKYRIEVPIKEAERLEKLLGIRSESDFTYVIDAFTSSEYLKAE